ncbi:MAG: zinc ribbon domain-containing protein [Gaiellaceae bacterium]
MSGLSVWRCDSCGRRSLPRRELCPYCGGRTFAAEPADRGIATQVTSHRGVGVACVRVGDDVTLLARADPAVVPGSQVTLRDDDGALVAELP